MFRNVLLASVAVASLTTGAFAADLPARVPAQAPAPYISAPVFSWTGFYAGLNAGVGFASSTSTVINASGGTFGTAGAFNLNPATGSNSAGFTGGGQLGYNWQINQAVVGLETDIQYRARGNRVNGTYAFAAGSPYLPAITSYTVNGVSNSSWFGTVRGRLGMSVDRALIYVTGGLAYGDVSSGGTIALAPTPPGTTFTTSNTSNVQAGYALGAGLEYAFTQNWTAKAEYLYVDLGRSSIAYADGTGRTYSLNQNNRDNIVRVGVNYKF